ncbi:MAG: 3-hydroxyacyl-CoA dehydrogenase NAD-binding domain-containing protein, partial [Saprospiraceae bacterium]|nr:3-hydroxyacyl-CoA dehydrogenase NAD-binding domain-containing protein [Saprospiraceae bacterium]
DRSSIAERALQAALKQKPAPLYLRAFAGHIETGNFTDHMARISECDWIIEVVVERLDVKRDLFARVDEHRKAGSIITTNTSGIPIHLIADGRSEDFRSHFLGTHFFNPPRYLKLLEVIPTQDTLPRVISQITHFCETYLGKEVVRCKDTPGFIANRVGVYAMALVFNVTAELGLSVTEVDKLTGPAIGRPKTGTFRLGDLVGLDVAHHVITGLQENCPDDSQVQQLQMPVFFQHLIQSGSFGTKSGKGFYQKSDEKDDKGRSIIFGLNLGTLTYERPAKSSLPSLQLVRQIEDLTKRIQALFAAEDAGGQLLRKTFAGLFAYVSKRIPEIADSIAAIDDALRAGFGWEMGPFEYWDALGIQSGIDAAREHGFEVADWVQAMVDNGHPVFYRTQQGQRMCFDPASSAYVEIAGSDRFVQLGTLRTR